MIALLARPFRIRVGMAVSDLVACGRMSSPRTALIMVLLPAEKAPRKATGNSGDLRRSSQERFLLR